MWPFCYHQALKGQTFGLSDYWIILNVLKSTFKKLNPAKKVHLRIFKRRITVDKQLRMFWKYKMLWIKWYPLKRGAGIYLLKVNNRSTRTRCEICSKLTICVVLVYLLLTLSIFDTCSSVSIVNFEYKRVNYIPDMTKALGKTIVKMSKLETKYFNNSTLGNRGKYKKQKWFCSNLWKKRGKNVVQIWNHVILMRMKPFGKIRNLF